MQKLGYAKKQGGTKMESEEARAILAKAIGIRLVVLDMSKIEFAQQLGISEQGLRWQIKKGMKVDQLRKIAGVLRLPVEVLLNQSLSPLLLLPPEDSEEGQ